MALTEGYFLPGNGIIVTPGEIGIRHSPVPGDCEIR